jgi:hypothetical protein
MNTGNKILFVICAITIVAGTAIYLEASKFQKTAKVTIGTVTNSGITYYDVNYTSDDGVERTHKGTHGKNRKAHNGDTKKVFYQTDNPDKSRITDGVKGGKTVIIIGIIMLLLNLYLVYTNKKRSKSANNFKTKGRKVAAEITKVDTDLSITMLKKHPWFIDCKWVDPMTGKEYTHTIRNIWTDPKTPLAGRNSIDVYIDRDDPDKYFMDIAFLGDIAT